MEPNTPSTSNYIYYVIEDNNHKVRGHVIGAQHWVEPKDQDLNRNIINAIGRSARVILEIPPNSAEPLLPSEAKAFKIIIKGAMEELKSMPKPEVASDPNSLKAEIEHLLKVIEDGGLKAGDKDQQGYKEIKMVLDELPSIEQKLNFLKVVHKDILDFNLVSLERNINEKVLEANKEYKPLEEHDLNKKLLEARLKVGLRNIKEKLAETDYQEMVKKINKIESGEKKLDFVKEEKIKLGIKDRKPPITPEKEQALKEALYRAWVNGDVKELKCLHETCSKIYIEEPEIDQVHQSRDKQMAERIIEVVSKAKENTEVAIMMGVDHLVYTRRTNIIDHLNECFKNDLKGWSITQITKSV